MNSDTTLPAHMVPRLTSQVEDAATDALAFILNKSEACRQALVDQLPQRTAAGRLRTVLCHT